MTVTEYNEWVPSTQCLEGILQSIPKGPVSYFPSSGKPFFSSAQAPFCSLCEGWGIHHLPPNILD